MKVTGDPTADDLDGEARAHRADSLKFDDPDALARAITNLLAEDGFIVPPTPRLAGFCRVLQVMLQRRR